LTRLFAAVYGRALPQPAPPDIFVAMSHIFRRLCVGTKWKCYSDTGSEGTMESSDVMTGSDVTRAPPPSSNVTRAPPDVSDLEGDHMQMAEWDDLPNPWFVDSPPPQPPPQHAVGGLTESLLLQHDQLMAAARPAMPPLTPNAVRPFTPWPTAVLDAARTADLLAHASAVPRRAPPLPPPQVRRPLTPPPPRAIRRSVASMFGLPGDVALPPPPLAVASLEALLVGKPLPALRVAEVTEFRHTPTYFGIYMNLSGEETGVHFCKGHATLLHTEMSPEPACRVNFAWIFGFAGVDFWVNFNGFLCEFLVDFSEPPARAGGSEKIHWKFTQKFT